MAYESTRAIRAASPCIQNLRALPAEHAAFLTRAATPNNVAANMQFFSVLGRVEDAIVDCFRNGGGVHYSEYTRFHGPEKGTRLFSVRKPLLLNHLRHSWNTDEIRRAEITRVGRHRRRPGDALAGIRRTFREDVSHARYMLHSQRIPAEHARRLQSNALWAGYQAQRSQAERTYA